MKNFLLKKGWAGRTIGRQESVDRLNAILQSHHEINAAYDTEVPGIGTEEDRNRLDALRRTSRADAGKLSETILSLGGVPASGIGLRASTTDADASTSVRRLIDLESKFLDRIAGESKVEHQMKSRAILGNSEANARERLEFLKSLDDKRS
jgi:hypothetical protein